MELEKRRRRLVYPCPSPGGNDYEQALQQNEVAWCKAKSTLPCKQSAEEPTFDRMGRPDFAPLTSS